MKVEVKDKEAIKEVADEKDEKEIISEEKIDDKVEDAVVGDEQDERDLELENARLKAKLEAHEEIRSERPIVTKRDPEDEKYQQTKSIVLADSGSLDDDSFQEKYKMSKAEAKVHFVNHERERDSNKHNEDMAFLRAENIITKKYEEEYSKYENQVSESISDLSPSVRQDPKKLALHIERTIKALKADEPAPKPQRKSAPRKQEDGEMDKRIVDSGFSKPNIVPDERNIDLDKNKDDEIAESDRSLAAKFGITSEKERLKYKNTNYIETDYGNGVKFGDPKRGFEKKKS